MTDPVDLLRAATAGPYLLSRGLIEPGSDITVRELGGGVSNIVLAVENGPRTFICKQSLPQLRVSDEWLADRGRIVAEADALRLTRTITPEHVPAVLDSDPEQCTLSIDHAPGGWSDWKSSLLRGAVDADIGRLLGRVLARWQNATLGGAGLTPRLQRYEAFDQLRIDPYHRTVARRHPDLALPVEAVIREMAERRICLTHGDFSPKNVLVGDGMWVIDFEVAHLGDPAFDVAFLLSHLLLKSIHRPEQVEDFCSCAAGFAAVWEQNAAPAVHPGWPAIGRQLGCLLLARVDGKSPAEYLEPAGQVQAWRLGTSLLHEPPETPEAIWNRRRTLLR